MHAGHGQNFIRTMLRLATERDSFRVVADQVGTPTSAALIADITAVAIHTIEAGAALDAGIYHLTAAGNTTWHGLAQFVIETALAQGAPLKATPDEVLAIPTTAYPTPAARPANSRLDTAKVRAALNLNLPDWRDGARQTVAALLAQGLV